MIYKILAVYLISAVLPLLIIGKQKETLKLEGDYYSLMYISLFPFVNSVFLAVLIVSYVCFKLSDFISFIESDRTDKRKLLKDLIEHVKKEEVYGHNLGDYYKTGILTVYQDGDVELNKVVMKNTLSSRQGKKLFKEIKRVFREQEGYDEEVKIKKERKAIEEFYKSII